MPQKDAKGTNKICVFFSNKHQKNKTVRGKFENKKEEHMQRNRCNQQTNIFFLLKKHQKQNQENDKQKKTQKNE